MALGSEYLWLLCLNLWQGTNNIYRLLAAADFGMLWSPNTALVVML